MKRIFSLLALLLTGIIASPVAAQETVENELEMVRQLRARNWNEVAKTRIEELLLRGDPVLDAALPIELARTNIAIARQQDPEQRLTLFTAAASQLEEFIKKNQGKPQAALAMVELARVTSYQGQAILAKAMREEENKDRHEKARSAETKFLLAGKDLAEASKAIEAAIKDPANAAHKAVLERELLQSRLDLAVNLFDQAKTYIDRGKSSVNSQRSETMSKAIEAFKAIKGEDTSEIGWLASAWLMKCSMETTEPDAVFDYYRKIINLKDDKAANPAIQPAVRLARYFYMQDTTLPRADDPETIGHNAVFGRASKVKKTTLDRLHEVQAQGEDWLKSYPNHHRSYEGQGVRFETAQAYLTEAFMEKDQKNPKLAAVYKNAGDHFKVLGDYDGDFADRSRQLALSIEFKLVGESKTELKTFDQFLMKAMIERKTVGELSRKMNEAKPDDVKGIEADRKKHLKGAIEALNKALELAEGTKTPTSRVDDARFYLIGAYLFYGDAYRAAVVAENLGRAKSSRRSPDAAATAIQTYSILHTRHPDDPTIRPRMFDMANFILSQKAWSTETAASMAHYHLALAAKKDNPKKAIEHLEKLSPEFVDYIYTQGQLVFIAQAARENVEDKKEKAWYVAAAKKAIERMPVFNPKEDSPSVLAMYFYAKLEMAKFVYGEAMEGLNDPSKHLVAVKKCNEMSKYVKDLRGQFDKLPDKSISPETREQLDFSMSIMLKYADLGIAETKFRGDTADRFDEVLKATKTVVDAMKEKAKAIPAAEKIKLKDYRVTGDILGLALRASVQKGDVQTGKEILNILNRLTDLEERAGGNVVAVVLNDIAAQIKSAKGTAGFQKTRGAYIEFLDAITKEYKDKGNFDKNAAILLAHAYMSLDMPSKAAPLFGEVKAPAGIDVKIVKNLKETEEQTKKREALEEEFNRYWSVQIEYIRALRATKEKESFKTAESAADTLIKHPNAKYKLQATMEKNFLAEDQTKYRIAAAGWQAFMKTPGLVTNLDKKEVQQLYFPGYFYYIRTLYRTGILDPDIKDRPKMITGAARMILNLENAKTKAGWEIVAPLINEYLKEKEAEPLKKEYEKLKGVKSSALVVPLRDVAAYREVPSVESPVVLARSMRRLP